MRVGIKCLLFVLCSMFLAGKVVSESPRETVNITEHNYKEEGFLVTVEDDGEFILIKVFYPKKSKSGLIPVASNFWWRESEDRASMYGALWAKPAKEPMAYTLFPSSRGLEGLSLQIVYSCEGCGMGGVYAKNYTIHSFEPWNKDGQ